MILSYNVDKTSLVSSDESMVEEIEASLTILEEKNKNECPTASSDLKTTCEDILRVTAPSITTLPKLSDLNSSSSNLSSLSGKEEDYIQKDVLNMLNQSINKRTQGETPETEKFFSYNMFQQEEECQSTKEKDDQIQSFYDILLAANKYESDDENFQHIRKELIQKQEKEKPITDLEIKNNSVAEYDVAYPADSNLYNMFPSFEDFSNYEKTQRQLDVNEGQNSLSSIHRTQQKSQMKNIHNYLDMNIDELLKYCHLICKDQAGCRFLQKKVDEDPSLANDFISFAIKDKIVDLMYDGYGNYFVQKLFDSITEDKLEQILKNISPHFLSLGLDPHGTRVLQNIIQNIKSDSFLLYFTQLLIPHMLELIKDSNGNHILIKYASTIPFPRNCIIFEFLNCNIADISIHKHSCCALQKCLAVANDLQKNLLFNSIAAKAELLISDPYGNYVVQLVMTQADHDINAKIAHAFGKNIGFLSKQKFSSNVIEKCFDYCNDNTKFLIVKEICNSMILPELLLDMYGNYVIQKVLAYAIEPYRSIILHSIGPHIEKLKNVSFGPKLYVKLLFLYPELNNYLYNQNTCKEQKPKKKCRKKQAMNCVQNMNPVNMKYGYMNTQHFMNIFPCINNNISTSLMPRTSLGQYSYLNSMSINMPIQSNIKAKGYYSNNLAMKNKHY